MRRAALERQLDITQAPQEVGEVTRIDVAQARAQLVGGKSIREPRVLAGCRVLKVAFLERC